MLRRLAWGVVFLTALVVNPNLACSSDPGAGDDDFTYTESQMEEGAVGTYSGTAEGSDEMVTLVIRRAPAAQGTSGASSVRPQCGSRSFVAPASACVSVSTMAIEGELTSSEGTFDAVLDGTFMAFYTLESAQLELSDGQQVSLVAHYAEGALQGFRFHRGTDAVDLNLQRE